jgi:hypothetical protein
MLSFEREHPVNWDVYHQPTRRVRGMSATARTRHQRERAATRYARIVETPVPDYPPQH